LNHGSEIYLHIDLDVFDPAELIANHYNVKNGLFLAEALDFIKHLKNKYKITAVAFTAYDPTYDPENKGFKIVTGILDEIIVHQE